MAIRIWISEITFSDDTSIQLTKDDIIVFVGPNNAGKSASLKEMATLLNAKANKGKVVKDITIEKEGDEIELYALLDKTSVKQHSGKNLLYTGPNFQIWESSVKGSFSGYTNGLGQLISLFANSLTTEQRLQAANPAQNFNLTVFDRLIA